MATPADADLVLRLYDLRREAVMRQARAWFIAWAPASADEVRAVLADFGRQENAWVRQLTSYWEMAYSIANAGCVDPDLFAKNAGEGVLVAVKCQVFKARFPDAWTRTMPEVEAFLAGNAIAQQKAEMFRKRFG
jgi:hypothetical protein